MVETEDPVVLARRLAVLVVKAALVVTASLRPSRLLPAAMVPARRSV
jgi:hypothetical protein